MRRKFSGWRRPAADAAPDTAGGRQRDGEAEDAAGPNAKPDRPSARREQ